MNTLEKFGEVVTRPTPGADVIVDVGVLTGARFGIAAISATDPAPNGYEAQVRGQVLLAKKTPETWLDGDRIHWDDTAKDGTNVGPADGYIGVSVGGADSAATSGSVLLNDTGLPAPVQTSDLADSSVTSVKIADGTIVFADTAMFVSTEQTGTGAPQNVAHGLGVTPSEVLVIPTDTAPATVGDYTAIEGAHDSTNVIVTVTLSKKFKVWAMA